VKSGVTSKDYGKPTVQSPPKTRSAVVKEQRGIYRVPEPKILPDRNYATSGLRTG